MGIKLREIVPRKEISFDDLSGKKIAVDASNSIYQFLSSIRQANGEPLSDSQGNITSHLVGLFSRNVNLMKRGVKLCYVFDGKPPALKIYEKEAREHRKRLAEERLEEAKEEEDVESIIKYSKQTVRMNKEIVEESKNFLQALGIPVIQAPSEADAQAAFMCSNGDVWAVASSDMDSLLHGAKRILPNLTLSQRRRSSSGKVISISPELIELDEVLKTLEITQDQLIILGILVGTDYNRKGIKGIGPKKALKLIKDHKNFDLLFKEVNADFDWKQIFDIFKKMPVIKNYELKWEKPDVEKIKEILIDKHDFSEERVDKTLSELLKHKIEKQQTGLGKWVN